MSAVTQNNFDWQYYLEQNSDLPSNINTPYKAYYHWQKFGQKTGRPYRLLNENKKLDINNNKKLIIFICNRDWANVRTHMSCLINRYSNKYQSVTICLSKHVFDYELKHDYDLLSNPKEIAPIVTTLIHKADIVYWAEESQRCIFEKYVPNFWKNILPKKKVIGHSGSEYRKFYKKYNHQDLDIFDYQILNTDLYRLSPLNKKIPLIQCCDIEPVSYDDLYNRYNEPNIIICHAPSKRHKKGSDAIDEVINRILFKYEHVKYVQLNKNMQHDEILKLKKHAHIYIDQYNLKVGGFGVSSLESLAYGSIVLCSINNLNKNIWTTLDISPPPIIDIGVNIDDFYDIVDSLISQTKETLLNQSMQSINWYNKYIYGDKYVQLIERTIFNKLIM